MIVSPGDDNFPNFAAGKEVLRAQRVRRDIYSDPEIVITWSTDCGPYDLLMRCPPIASDHLRSIQIVADEYIFTGNSPYGRPEALEGRSVVRFNASDWTVIWMAATKTEGAQIQAVFKIMPLAMVEMVRRSAAGVISNRVDEFFERLQAALAT